MNSDTYIPGACNIGKGEIRRRQTVALIGAVLTLTSVIGFLSTHETATTRVSIFIPLAITSIGWVQSRKKFCLAYGFMGTFNFGKLGSISKVADPISKAADRKTALLILGQALLYAALGTALAVALPL